MSQKPWNENYQFMGQPLTEERLQEIIRETIDADREDRKHSRRDGAGGSEAVGAIVLSYRNRERLSQAGLAGLSGLHPTTIGKIEAGLRGMSLETFSRLCGPLGLQFAAEIITEVGQWPKE